MGTRVHKLSSDTAPELTLYVRPECADVLAWFSPSSIAYMAFHGAPLE